jgi:tetratricopeptide (TPR) repeat protein
MNHIHETSIHRDPSRSRAARWLALAAASALPVMAWTLPASAQQRVGSDGHALDANNRIGSNGLNSNTRSGNNPQVTPNQIVYGNVTGGRAFSGPLQSTDPEAFRGATAGEGVDRFVRDSSGVPQQYAPAPAMTQVQPFYGGSRGVAPPAGYVPEGSTGGYVRAPLSPVRSASDARLGDVTPGVRNTVLPQPGELVLPGPVDNQNNNTLITASPLYGIRQWQPGNAADQYFLDNFTTLGHQSGLGVLDLDQATLRKMQEQLRNGGLNPQKAVNPNAPASDQQQMETQGSSVNANRPNLSQPLDVPLEAPDNSPLTQQQLTQNLSADRLGSSVQTQASARNQLLTPAQQSTQYAEMRKRFEAKEKLRNLSDEDAQRLFAQQMRLKDQAEAEAEKDKKKQQSPPTDAQAAQPGNAQPGIGVKPKSDQPQSSLERFGIPDYRKQSEQIMRSDRSNPSDAHTGAGTGIEGTPGNQVNPQAAEPLKVESLATGVSSPGLSSLLKRGEQLMREGKYTSAIAQYETAQRLVPNSALVTVGRANAELGGGYYAQAAEHLHQAFTGDPTVLMGQFDLKAFIGSERLTKVINDLKAIAAKNTDDAAPMLLLSYVAYNTGNAPLAATWLAEADRRSGGKDRVYTLIRNHWALPAATSEPDLNK